MSRRRRKNPVTCSFCSRDTFAKSGVCKECRIPGDTVDSKRRDYYYAGGSKSEEDEDDDSFDDGYHGRSDRDDL